MHITKFTDYSLRVLLTLVTLPDNEQCQIKPLASALGISENHLIKIVHSLGKLGWIMTYRGRGGGFVLSEASKHLTIGEIVRQLEPNMKPIDCSSGYCPLQGNCSLENLMWQAKQAFLQSLDEKQLIDLVSMPQQFQTSTKHNFFQLV